MKLSCGCGHWFPYIAESNENVFYTRFNTGLSMLLCMNPSMPSSPGIVLASWSLDHAPLILLRLSHGVGTKVIYRKGGIFQARRGRQFIMTGNVQSAKLS